MASRKTLIGRYEHARKVALRADILLEQGKRCVYCFEPLTHSTATLDHIVPQSLKGPTERENSTVACRDCNMAKGSLSAAIFRKLIKRPPPGAPLSIWMAFARRRIWLAEFRASNRIRAAVGLELMKPPSLPAKRKSHITKE